MSFWGMITGAGAVDKTVDIADKTATGVMSGIDKVFYTPEEKAEAFQKRLEIADRMSQTHIELMKVTHSETTTRSITRRIAAIFIMCITAVAMVIIGALFKYDKEHAEFLLEMIKYFQVGWCFVGVFVFFFGNYVIQGFKK